MTLSDNWPLDILWKKVIYWFSWVVLLQFLTGPSISWSYSSWIYNYLCSQSLSPLTLWVRLPFRQGTLNTTLCDKVCQWLAAGRWFSPGTPVSSTNKTDHHDITEILLRVEVKHHNPPTQFLTIIFLLIFFFSSNIQPLYNNQVGL